MHVIDLPIQVHQCHAVVHAMDWYGNETLYNTPFTNMTLDGKAVAAIQNVDNFTFA